MALNFSNPRFTRGFLEKELESKSYLDIAQECEVSRTTIQRYLHSYGLTKPLRKWSRQEIALLESNYPKRMDLSKLFVGRSLYSIYHFGHKLKLKRPQGKRHWPVNVDFFKKFTPASCYVLGWLFSDGNISRGRVLRFHLQKRDKFVLYKLRKVMSSKHPVRVYGDHVKFGVNSKEMCDDLLKLGCGPHKAKKIRLPSQLPSSYLRHFVRGYFEGDGSIAFNYPNTLKIRLLGNRQFLFQLRNAICGALKIKCSKIKKAPSNVYSFNIYGDNARAFCKWIYSNCGKLYLRRKYLRFKKHMRLRRKDRKC